MPVTGWPLRAGRLAYGPTMRDERRTVNPTTEFNASQVNLSFWQQGAMGLIAPKAVMFIGRGEGPLFKVGYFSWDDVIYVDFPDLPSYVTFTRNSVGNYTFQFATSVLGRPDEDGVQQLEALNFQFAWADVNIDLDPSVRAFAEVTQVDPQTFNVFVTRAGSPADEPFAIAFF